MTTVHAGLVAALPADLVAAGAVSATGQVYFGRRAQNPARQDLEVFVERLDVNEQGSGAQLVHVHRYRFHVRGGPFNRGGDQTGEAQVAAVEVVQRTIVERYHGQRRLTGQAGLTDVAVWSAVADQPDVDPEDAKGLDSAVLVALHVRE